MRELNGNEYWSYDELVDSFEVEVVFDEHDNDYQGDSYYLLKDGDKYGILVFGWGSCSGCDALEACYGDLAEATRLRDSLWESVDWMDEEGLRQYCATKRWDSEWYYYREAGRKFTERLKSHLGINGE